MVIFIAYILKMWKPVVLCGVLACGVMCYQDQFIGTGQWAVDRTEQCPNPDQYEIQFELRKNKLNRTHIVFNGFLDLKEDLTEEGFGMYISSDKKVDGGGYKLIHVFDEDNLFKFLDKFVPRNFKSLLINLGVETEDYIPKGHYILSEFLLDYGELPKNGMLGTYLATIYVTKIMADKENEKIGCLMVHATFLEEDEANNDDDK